MLKLVWNWVRHREPVATVAGVAALFGAVATSVAGLPASASWTAVATAIAMVVVRQFVSPT